MKEINFQLTIQSITIGSIENASSFNIGRNFLRDFKSMSKTNAGVGTVSGHHNSFPASTNYVLDPDQVDMLWETGGGSRAEPAKRGAPFACFNEERK